MNRKQFIKTLSIITISGLAMNLNELNKIIEPLEATSKMPLLFLGHGIPMNAIEENEFVMGFRNISNEISKPKAILCISAHWETNGTFVTAMEKPETIHDFGGFPKALFEVQYPAHGSPELALETKKLITKTDVKLNHDWGLDHGSWSVIKHLYPDADVPVIQMSLDYNQTPQYHFELAQQLSKLRDKGVLIIGSGNIIHNLGMVDWKRLNEQFAYDWALEVNDKIKSFILDDNFKNLINYKSNGKAFEQAIPSPEHYLPLLYILALKEKNEKTFIFNDKPIAGALSMTSLKIGN